MTKWKLLFNLAAAIGLAAVIYFARDSIKEAFTYTREDLSLWLLLLQIPIQLVSLLSMAHFYHSYLTVMGALGKLRLKDLYKVILELSFVNRIFFSGGYQWFRLFKSKVKTFWYYHFFFDLCPNYTFCFNFYFLSFSFGNWPFIASHNWRC